MTNPIIKIVNVSTGQEIERPMNANELSVYNQDQLNAESKRQAETAKEEARSAAEAKLLELGLTVEDLKALLG